MDNKFFWGAGLSLLFAFARYRYPTVPKWLASAGMVLGVGLLVVSTMPPLKYGPMALGLSGLAIIAIAVEWQLSLRALQPLYPGLQHSHPGAVPAQSQVEATDPQAPSRPAAEPPLIDAPLLRREPSTIEDLASKQRDTAGERRAILNQLTQLYMLENDGISSRMTAGLELPPADFLNAELERQGATWRVRSVDGASVETHDVTEPAAAADSAR